MIVTTGTTGHAAELYLDLEIAELGDNMFLQSISVLSFEPVAVDVAVAPDRLDRDRGSEVVEDRRHWGRCAFTNRQYPKPSRAGGEQHEQHSSLRRPLLNHGGAGSWLSFQKVVAFVESRVQNHLTMQFRAADI